MIVGLTTSIAADPWLPSHAGEEAGPTNLAVLLLKDRAIGHLREPELRELVKALRAGNSPRPLIEAVAKLRLARPECSASPQVSVGPPPSGLESSLDVIPTIYQLAHSSSGIKSLGALPGGAHGSDREQVYIKNLHDMASRASKTVLFDRFGGKAILDRGINSGPAWLLRRLAQDGVPVIELVTAASGGHTESAIASKLRAVHGLADVRVLAGPASRAEHDRHIRFLFGNGRPALAVGLGKGGDIFAKPILDEAYDISWIPASNARHREDLLTKAREL